MEGSQGIDFQKLVVDPVNSHTSTQHSSTRGHVTTKTNDTQTLVTNETNDLDTAVGGLVGGGGEIDTSAQAINAHTSQEIANVKPALLKEIIIGQSMTWTPPFTGKARIICIGAGGSGGTAAGSGALNFIHATGGGAGAYVVKDIDLKAIPYTLVVGSGGVSQSGSYNSTKAGVDGGNTTFTGDGHALIAGGGKGGLGSQNKLHLLGGAGGVGSGGDIVHIGGAGGSSNATGSYMTACTGGGAVDLFGTGNTRGGNTVTYSSHGATGGGGVGGNGGDITSSSTTTNSYGGGVLSSGSTTWPGLGLSNLQDFAGSILFPLGSGSHSGNTIKTGAGGGGGGGQGATDYGNGGIFGGGGAYGNIHLRAGNGGIGGGGGASWVHNNTPICGAGGNGLIIIQYLEYAA